MADMLDQVKIVGWDTSPDEVEGVKDGSVVALISQDPFRMRYDGRPRGDRAHPRRHVGQGREHRRGRGHQEDLGNLRVQQFIDPTCGPPSHVDSAGSG
jgi:ribose transport system substrate-binding protein